MSEEPLTGFVPLLFCPIDSEGAGIHLFSDPYLSLCFEHRIRSRNVIRQQFLTLGAFGSKTRHGRIIGHSEGTGQSQVYSGEY